jgi:hypothetical protein
MFKKIEEIVTSNFSAGAAAADRYLIVNGANEGDPTLCLKRLARNVSLGNIFQWIISR